MPALFDIDTHISRIYFIAFTDMAKSNYKIGTDLHINMEHSVQEKSALLKAMEELTNMRIHMYSYQWKRSEF